MKQLSDTLREALRQTTATSYSFFVPGKPASQGSKVALPRLIRGKDGKPKAIANMREQDPSLAAWRYDVERMGRLMRPKDWDLEGHFILDAFFLMPRPKAHFDGRGELRYKAPYFHGSQKDCDKMFRAIGDALTGVCFSDDDLIALGTAAKLYCTETCPTGAWISVTRIDVQRAEQAIRLLMS
jgi:crossover junction endodeoxyribonuclease RusA